MNDLNEAPATGPTPTIVTNVASENLSASLDDAQQQQRRADVGTMLASVVCAALALLGLGMLVAYTVGGTW